MRLSNAGKTTLKRTILEDIYRPPSDSIRQRRNELAQTIYLDYLSPYMPLLDQLPPALKRMGTIVSVTNEQLNQKSTFSITANFTEKVCVPFGYAYGVPDFNIPLSLLNVYQEAILSSLQEEDELKQAKLSLEKYLQETLEVATTTKHLKTLWDPTLHKYIPVDIPQRSKSPTVIDTSSISTTVNVDALKTQMAINMLEAA